MPLRHGARVTGAIVISKLGLNQFDEDDVRLLEVLAGHASVALENARLYQQQRREAEGANALLAFADEVSRAESFEEICTRTVETATALFETERASLWLGDECAASVGAPIASGITSALAEGDGISGRLVLDARRARRAWREAPRIVLVPGVGRAPEGPALLAAARGGGDRERAARREPRARNGRIAGGCAPDARSR